MNGKQLHRRSIFLSASVPNRAEWPESKSRQAGAIIRTAVIACTKRVLLEGGTLGGGGHPSISPFILSAADDYSLGPQRQTDLSTPRIWIYQSKAFPPAVRPTATKRLIERGARLVDVDAAPVEKFEPGLKAEQCLGSMVKMREDMLTNSQPIAMVVIGGSEGVLRECAAFREKFSDRPICAFESTSGMASQLRAPRTETVEKFYKKLNCRPEKIKASSAEDLLLKPGDTKQVSEPPYVLLAERISTATLKALALSSRSES